MVFEIEKRSLFSSKESFEKCEERVSKLGKFRKTYIYKSYLFREPYHLRVRLVKGTDYATITTKSGDYQSAAREEHNEDIPLSVLQSYLDKLVLKGFTKCARITTVSNSYELDWLRVDFNAMNYLGFIVEVEALTEDHNEIPMLEQKVVENMKKLGLTQLSAQDYQSMMDRMFLDALKPVSEQEFSI
jgi:predicted adenylyl cyclase CyaB